MDRAEIMEGHARRGRETMIRMRSLPRTSRFLFALAVVCGLTMAACKDTNEPLGLSGSYVATTWLFGPTGQAPTNVLQAGGSMSLQIAADNTTAGSLNVPASITGGAALIADMKGTATQTGDTVRFTQAANSFVRSHYWIMANNTLRFERTIDGTTMLLVLTR